MISDDISEEYFRISFWREVRPWWLRHGLRIQVESLGTMLLMSHSMETFRTHHLGPFFWFRQSQSRRIAIGSFCCALICISQVGTLSCELLLRRSIFHSPSENVHLLEAQHVSCARLHEYFEDRRRHRNSTRAEGISSSDRSDNKYQVVKPSFSHSPSNNLSFQFYSLMRIAVEKFGFVLQYLYINKLYN